MGKGNYHWKDSGKDAGKKKRILATPDTVKRRANTKDVVGYKNHLQTREKKVGLVPFRTILAGHEDRTAHVNMQLIAHPLIIVPLCHIV